jgi:hypothetical protein
LSQAIASSAGAFEYETSLEVLCGRCDGRSPRLRRRQRECCSDQPVVKAESPAVTVYNQGVDLMNAKEFAQAQGKFEQAVKLDPEFAEAFKLRKQGSANFQKSYLCRSVAAPGAAASIASANSSARITLKPSLPQTGPPRTEPRAHLISLERDGFVQQNRHPSGICKSHAVATPKISLLPAICRPHES